jgi:hypothetical protein
VKAASVLLVAALLTTACAGTIETAEPNSGKVDTVRMVAKVDPASKTPAAQTPDPETVFPTTSTSGVKIEKCTAPSEPGSTASSVFVELHDAIDVVVRHTNALGKGLTAINNFEPGWESREPIASTIALLVEEVEQVEMIASAVLRDEFGAAFDQEYGWEFPRDALPLSPALGNLEELATSVDMYRNEILPLLFSIRSLPEAVDYWNHGASPCGHANGMVERLDGALRAVSSGTPSSSLAPRRWISRSYMDPRIAVTFDIGGWGAIDIGCDGLLDYAKLSHYPHFGASAAIYIGPIHQDCSFQDLIVGLPPMDSPSVETRIGIDQWDALRYEESYPDWSYLGVRYGPSNRGVGTLYLIDGDARNYFVYITAHADVFDDFATLAEPILASLDLDVET